MTATQRKDIFKKACATQLCNYLEAELKSIKTTIEYDRHDMFKYIGDSLREIARGFDFLTEGGAYEKSVPVDPAADCR